MNVLNSKLGQATPTILLTMSVISIIYLIYSPGAVPSTINSTGQTFTQVFFSAQGTSEPTPCRFPTRPCSTTYKGECAIGTENCYDGQWSGCPAPQNEICDSKDNDCDGSTDEGLTQSCSIRFLGACAVGSETCSAGNWAGCPTPGTEICSNIIDEDCTGVDLICPTCSQGAITQRCLCGSTAYSTGYCCSNQWQSGSCSVSCPQGQILCNNSCTISVCSSNAQCNDNNPLTNDTCINSGACNAYCSNTAIANCPNGKVTSSCNCGGTIISSSYCCSNSPFTPPCTVDSECNDLDSSTTDSCQGTGTCSAQCVHASSASCGNGIEDLGENCTNCPQDIQCSSGELCCYGLCWLPFCSSDADCTIEGLLTGTCIEPNSCNADCVYYEVPGGIPGGKGYCGGFECSASEMCCDEFCIAPMCSSDEECDDFDSCTEDFCDYAGTCNAYCYNLPGISCDGETKKQFYVSYEEEIVDGEKFNLKILDLELLEPVEGATAAYDNNSVISDENGLVGFVARKTSVSLKVARGGYELYTAKLNILDKAPAEKCSDDVCGTGEKSSCPQDCGLVKLGKKIIAKISPQKISENQKVVLEVEDEEGKPLMNALVGYAGKILFTDTQGKTQFIASKNEGQFTVSKAGYQTISKDIPFENELTIKITAECGNGACEAGETAGNCGQDCKAFDVIALIGTAFVLATLISTIVFLFKRFKLVRKTPGHPITHHHDEEEHEMQEMKL
ncbi:MAG: hypothetical protein AB1467_01985 [Candidatus Diapherotrites archaeon]